MPPVSISHLIESAHRTATFGDAPMPDENRPAPLEAEVAPPRKSPLKSPIEIIMQVHRETPDLINDIAREVFYPGSTARPSPLPVKPPPISPSGKTLPPPSHAVIQASTPTGRPKNVDCVAGAITPPAAVKTNPGHANKKTLDNRQIRALRIRWAWKKQKKSYRETGGASKIAEMVTAQAKGKEMTADDVRQLFSDLKIPSRWDDVIRVHFPDDRLFLE